MKEAIWKSFDFKGETDSLLYMLRDEPHVFFLDSSLNDSHRGRYSFIGFDPFFVCSAKGKTSLSFLKKTFFKYKSEKRKSFSPFDAGVVGFLAYDAGLYFEKIFLQSKDDLKLPDSFFGFYDCVITIDHFARKLYICSSGLPETSSFLQKARAQERMARIVDKFSQYEDKSKNLFNFKRFYKSFCWEGIREKLSSNFTKEQYLEAVRKALEYIACGDIYQVNLSQRFTFDLGNRGVPMDFVRLYQLLRGISPTHFGCYFDGGDFKVMSSSPERFLSLIDGVVQTRPMKGTRSRGKNLEEDRKLREELSKSPKEQAELLMITDLERNDLGRVCEFGSVKVKEMRTLEEYRTVFQATSTVEGILKKGNNCFDLMSACFPGGSVTGCPKIRAMEIIEELEPNRRGIYTGAMGYIDFSGNMDFNILIRTLLAHNNKVHFHAGGGIVSDSIPEKEYEETLIKAKAMGACLAAAFDLEEKAPQLKVPVHYWSFL